MVKKIETHGKHFDLLAFGEALIEFARLPEGTYRKAFAGDTLNSAYYASHLGLRTKYITAFGNDIYSDDLQQFIKSVPIDISDCVRHPSRNNGLYTIEYDKNGKRHFTFWRDRSAAKELFSLIDDPVLVKSIDDASTVLFSLIGSAIWNDSAKLLRTLRSAANTIRCFDTNFRPSLWHGVSDARNAIESVSDVTDILFVSSSDHLALYDNTDPIRHYRSIGFSNIIYRDEKRPVQYIINGLEGEITKIPNIDIVDTTGAGDAFNAGFLSRYLAGRPIDDCIRYAICSASAAMQGLGGMSQAYSKKDVELLLENVYGIEQ
jgi:2-dehydro-3-deoxygluconokinase